MARAAYPAPVSKLPIELLSYIFILGAHTPDPDDSEVDSRGVADTRVASVAAAEEAQDISPCLSSSSTTPDLFAAVSRHWREVALNTPQLWNRVCVTIGDIEHGGSGGWFPIVSRYLARSGQCPLDVYIDARDPGWDFCEEDSIGAVVSPDIDETYDYTHPFKAEHMHYLLNIILPHVCRLRSLAILTDRWASMRTALECLSFRDPTFVSLPNPAPLCLPLLESLVLMRCNEFVSFHHRFSPPGQHKPAYLPFRGLISHSEPSYPREQRILLPRLRQLTLSGVHLDWSSLPLLLPPSRISGNSGLKRLELSYHCAEVRPTEEELREILQRCAGLRTLTVRVSGPQTPESSKPATSMPPVALPSLKALEVGYYDVEACTALLSMITCSEVEHVTLENSYPVRDESLDAGPLLLACAKVTAFTSPRHGQPVFPRAKTVTLRRVEASAEAFEAFYEALPSIRELMVAHMFLLGGKALTSRDVNLTFIPPDSPISPSASYVWGQGQDQWDEKRATLAEKYEETRVGRSLGVVPDSQPRTIF
ncbi:hypothetical protein PYCCODRAFT_1470710 [Trametes coccinea BRFM310]|uniref:Uncharacterized protein n=1 Tax=Trametes coccinea (strain BRFM310) TaxID=1353009 RepID=A0A1Y2IEX7_TRAC3|nr:hypothetical protein PYCCODRAFT_1470710 [Trametes coccinea BRFM310]